MGFSNSDGCHLPQRTFDIGDVEIELPGELVCGGIVLLQRAHEFGNPALQQVRIA